MKYFPYPDNRGQTHYEDCYRERRHHNCAVAEVDRLITEVRQAFSEGFWVGMDAPAELPKGYVDKAFAERKQKPVSGSQKPCEHEFLEGVAGTFCTKCRASPEDLDDTQQKQP